MNYPAKILVVDDDAIASFIIKKNLHNHGYQNLVMFDNAEETLSQFSGMLPAAAIVDLNLGSSSGIALASELIRRQPGLPIIFLSASVDPEQIASARSIENAIYVDRFSPFEEIINHLNLVTLGK